MFRIYAAGLFAALCLPLAAAASSGHSYTDTVWCDDAVPAGAQQMAGAAGEGWTWISSSPAPFSGSLSHQSILAAGLHDHSFNYASTPLAIGANDELFTYVYLNPTNPPTEIMLSWNDGSSWEHRAFWGADQIDYGSDGTPGRVNMGALPAAGQWVRLTVPASQVGLGGLSIAGMGFSTFGGQAAYDCSGDSVFNGSAGTGSSGSGSSGASGAVNTAPGNPSLPAVGLISGSFGADPANRTADVTQPAGDYVEDTALQLPQVGDSELHVISPTVLELVYITSKAPDPAPVTAWNFVNAGGVATKPAPAEFTVMVNGAAQAVTGVGFKRRVLYAPLNTYDLRIENDLYLTLGAALGASQTVAVTNPDGTLWPVTMKFAGSSSPNRNSRAIHVNQEGYAPEFAKRAVVGYYLGDLGELPIAAGTKFSLISTASGAAVYSGTLTLSADSGYQTTPLPYQQVYVADFSSYTTPGQYEIQIPGLGVSLPFLIDDGIAMAWARTYALGLYEQRSGMAVALPFTRFTHAADHTAPASIPVPDSAPQFAFTWNCIGGYAATVNTANPAQLAPFLTSNETSLYPFVNTGTVDVSGGHFDAGDYSKYTINSAQLVHELIFATDNIPGCSGFDNLAIPESGDRIPDALQEAKWEADFLAKMQDADGGFYFLVYPLDREYESNVLPENGDPQVVWPKNTSATAAAVAALAEAGSSPAMKQFYPQAAAQYLQAATAGWNFLMNAIAKHGLAGSYQKITFYGDDWTHDDELAWAAAAMYAATGNTAYQTQLFAWFPNPADPSTFRWGWQQMAECWGNAIRTYAFAARSGRLPASALNASYLALCNAQIVAAGDNAAAWSQACAYGTPFPPETKAVLGGGWYFSLDQASDMAVAYQVDPKPAYIDGLVAAMDYEGGTNPVNVCYLEGLGVKRQQQVVSQYAQNSRRLLAPTGFVAGQVTAGYEYLSQYGSELSELSYPTDSGSASTYPYYDRWADAYNVTTEQITVNLARSFMATGFLASLTQSSATPWTATAATIVVPSGTPALDKALTLTVQVPGQSLTNARIVWEGRDQEPALGASF
ncbi:MAG TPA: glycoside hydrolase family 9 protein, partial [Opitutaceae bacterium]|nr:glycoside hydrolase family 9 protein [Opitutaceae bacterium]